VYIFKSRHHKDLRQIIWAIKMSDGAKYENPPVDTEPQSSASTLSTLSGSQLAKMRKEYSPVALSEDDELVRMGPEALFAAWLSEAHQLKLLEPNAMCLSTCKDNVPSARYVLLKSQDKDGFVWFTNYESNKGQQLLANPRAALTFFWGPMERQVRVEGQVHIVSAQESDEYFAIRPRDSQIGAWASNQSRAIENRAELDRKLELTTKSFEGTTSVPRPAHWGGYRLVPSRIEFWRGKPNRMHDRILFERVDGGEWTIQRLQP
jgi:pyridoxamine 5'-phosphate oxidase